MTTLYLAGGEVHSHRKILTTLEAPAVALSYMGLRRKIKFARPWLLHDKFLESQQIFLDSGAYTVNHGEGTGKYSQRDLKLISDHYQSFVEDNLDRVSLVSEFDALPLGKEWIDQQREEFYDQIPGDKFLPIWHPEWGVDILHEMAAKYQNIGIMATVVDGRNIAPILNSIAQAGTRLHGVGITSVDDMYAIQWNSLSSTSWISPQQHGDTIVWTGRELKRYPMKYKQQARKRFRVMFEREGFDSSKIEADDSTELLRLSIWSWQQLMDDIDRKRPTHLRLVTTTDEEVSEEIPEKSPEVVDRETGEVWNRLPTLVRQPVALPVLGALSRTITEVDPETGEEKTSEVSQFGIRSDSQRTCVSCYLATKCPAFEPNSNCAYNIPVKVESREQFDQIQNALIEMQVQRVSFMRFAEETEGGYADPNLSGEMDRLQKMLKHQYEMKYEEGFSYTVEAKAKGAGAGMLGRLFGDQASAKARSLPEPIDADDVIDAMIIEEKDT